MNVIEKFHVSTNDVRYTEHMIKICYSLEFFYIEYCDTKPAVCTRVSRNS